MGVEEKGLGGGFRGHVAGATGELSLQGEEWAGTEGMWGKKMCSELALRGKGEDLMYSGGHKWVGYVGP